MKMRISVIVVYFVLMYSTVFSQNKFGRETIYGKWRVTESVDCYLMFEGKYDYINSVSCRNNAILTITDSAMCMVPEYSFNFINCFSYKSNEFKLSDSLINNPEILTQCFNDVYLKHSMYSLIDNIIKNPSSFVFVQTDCFNDEGNNYPFFVIIDARHIIHCSINSLLFLEKL